jgi:orotate phosphoribosyltransferase
VPKIEVRNLYQQLYSNGIEPWLDEEDLLPGQDWEREIRKAVRTLDTVIVCLSRKAINKRGFIQKEIKYALDVADEHPEGTIFIIPLKLEECEVPDRLRRWQWVNLFEEHGYERLICALQKRHRDVKVREKSEIREKDETIKKNLELKNEKSEYDEKQNFIELVATLNDGISNKRFLKDIDYISYFVDFDLITNNPNNSKLIHNAYIKYINSIKNSSKFSPDFLGFIEGEFGSLGSIKLASHLSIQTNIPIITIKLSKLLAFEKIKIFSEPIDNRKRLFGKNVLLISDVSTSGVELWKSIKLIRNEGGEVHDIILYYSRLSKETVEEFLKEDINIYPLILPSDARYVSYSKILEENKINRLRDVLRIADQDLKENELLVGNSPIISEIEIKSDNKSPSSERKKDAKQ